MTLFRFLTASQTDIYSLTKGPPTPHLKITFLNSELQCASITIINQSINQLLIKQSNFYLQRKRKDYSYIHWWKKLKVVDHAGSVRRQIIDWSFVSSGPLATLRAIDVLVGKIFHWKYKVPNIDDYKTT